MAKAKAAGDPFDALGNPLRRDIVGLLAAGPRSVQELADDLPISRPAVSRHLRLLGEAGLVTDEESGTRRIYRLDEAGAQVAFEYLQRFWGDTTARFRMFAENTRPVRPS